MAKFSIDQMMSSLDTYKQYYAHRQDFQLFDISNVAMILIVLHPPDMVMISLKLYETEGVILCCRKSKGTLIRQLLFFPVFSTLVFERYIRFDCNQGPKICRRVWDVSGYIFSFFAAPRKRQQLPTHPRFSRSSKKKRLIG